ncbi:MAG: hypothetical protein OEM52_01085 [bacterium]|nr:hypothetical protein [bacterium]
MAFHPSKRAKFRGGEYADPDLLPLMNIMLILIPLLISIVSFIKFSQIDYNPSPDMGGGAADMGSGGGGSGADLPKLNMLINIVESGFQISVKNALPGMPGYYDVPKLPNGQYDFDGLQNRLSEIRKTIIGEPTKTEEVIDPVSRKKAYRLTFAFADAQQVRVSAKGDLPWKVCTRLLDMFRVYPGSKLPNGQPMPLFSEPVFGQIQ